MTHQTILALLVAAALSACGGQQTQNTASSAPAASASAASASAPQQDGKPANKPLEPHTDIKGEVITVKTTRGDFPVPKNPTNVAVYDYGMLDTLTALGVNVGATIDKSNIEYLKPVVEKAAHVGTLFEPNYEALNAFQPQLIITGSRANKAIHELNKIAPTIEMTADTKNLLASSKERIDAFAQIFDKQAEADKLKAEIDAAFADAKAAAQGKGKGLVLIVNAGKLSAQSPNSRLGGWLHQDIGIPAVDADMKEGSHGMPVSFEYVKEKNPDWLFVLDRGAAIGEEGQAAKDVLNNPLIAETTAWKKGQVVYLDSGTYLAAGGARQLQIAAKQAADAFKAAK
ncbi:siderophore ABC transporter substrate-binding protein [Kingella kingae]|uniref:siderophore ABC transporter substrate-binding protein n=1 Tax=Kingella kingae TaxID=504 RepID=UPI00254D34DD|nr:siderophore ABC transporter substrate-binding protein [Kingella kingae]MDK4650466.1 siderophore ABC transporter substrate-binding protein [Kingella kingae]